MDECVYITHPLEFPMTPLKIRRTWSDAVLQYQPAVFFNLNLKEFPRVDFYG